MQTAFVFRDLWGSLLMQLITLLRTNIANGNLKLPVKAVAYHAGEEVLSIEIEHDEIKNMSCREIKIAMFPLTLTVRDASGQKDLTISIP